MSNYVIYHAPSGMFLAEFENNERVMFVDSMEMAHQGPRQEIEGLANAIESMVPEVGCHLLLVSVEPSGCDLNPALH